MACAFYERYGDQSLKHTISHRVCEPKLGDYTFVPFDSFWLLYWPQIVAPQSPATGRLSAPPAPSYNVRLIKGGEGISSALTLQVTRAQDDVPEARSIHSVRITMAL
jgi:hypothetical protein